MKSIGINDALSIPLEEVKARLHQANLRFSHVKQFSHQFHENHKQELDCTRAILNGTTTSLERGQRIQIQEQHRQGRIAKMIK